MKEEVVSAGVIEVKTVESMPQADVVIRLKPGGQLQTVKVTRRKTDRVADVLITINKSTVLVVE